MSAKIPAPHRPPIRLPRCPRCSSENVKVAMLTDWSSFLRCKDCLHDWTVPTSSLHPTDAE